MSTKSGQLQTLEKGDLDNRFLRRHGPYTTLRARFVLSHLLNQ